MDIFKLKIVTLLIGRGKLSDKADCLFDILKPPRRKAKRVKKEEDGETKEKSGLAGLAKSGMGNITSLINAPESEFYERKLAHHSERL